VTTYKIFGNTTDKRLLTKQTFVITIVSNTTYKRWKGMCKTCKIESHGFSKL